jgi:hypothetical protein
MRLFLSLLAVVLTASCVFHRVDVQPVEVPADAPLTIESPVKAHLRDGSTVVFANGIRVQSGTITGDGRMYDLALATSTRISSIAVADVAAMESFQTPVRQAETAAGTAVAGTGLVFGGLFLAKALFGSCPTTYSLAGSEPVLEAESFSYSIAPAFEARDVDRLGVQPVGDSVVLELRNEALETHYINELALLEINHAVDEIVYPDPRGRALVVGSVVSPAYAIDSSARNVTDVLARADGTAWRAPDERLRRVADDDFEDYVDLEFELPQETREAALILRLRNSLLNTVLLYDVMLKGQGWQALDWMGRDLDRFPDRLRLGYWYRERMGMRISVWEHGRFRQVARLPDTGPIAWQEVALPVPVTKGATLKVRLSYVADNWRIDWVGAAANVRTASQRRIAVRDVQLPSGDELPQAADYLRDADDAYLLTKPGDRLTLRFDVGPAPPDVRRTYFLDATGYYIEWMRNEWLQTTTAAAFRPSDGALLEALSLWGTRRDSFREQFEATRINVR